MSQPVIKAEEKCVERIEQSKAKPDLRIRIPASLSDEEILRSPIDTPSAPVPLAFLRYVPWIKSK